MVWALSASVDLVERRPPRAGCPPAPGRDPVADPGPARVVGGGPGRGTAQVGVGLRSGCHALNGGGATVGARADDGCWTSEAGGGDRQVGGSRLLCRSAGPRRVAAPVAALLAGLSDATCRRSGGPPPRHTANPP